MQLSLRADFPDLQRKLDALHGAVRDQVLAGAINRTLDQARTQMVRQITAEFNVKAAYVREKLRIRRASSRGLVFEGALVGTNPKRSANVIRYLLPGSTKLAKLRGTRKKPGTGQLAFKILKKGPATVIPGAFIGSGGKTVFRRVGKGRLPIEPVQVIDVPQMFTTRRVNSVVQRAIRDRLPANFERDARFYVARFNAGKG